MPCNKLNTSEWSSGLLEIRSALKVLLKHISGAIHTCREHLQSEGDSVAETPSRNLQSEAVPSQPEISDKGAAETMQAVCQPCNVEPHTLSFVVSGGLAQRLCKAAAELDTAVATVWEEALDYERVDLALQRCVVHQTAYSPVRCLKLAVRLVSKIGGTALTWSRARGQRSFTKPSGRPVPE